MSFFCEDGCFEWYKELEKENLILSFKGDFNHELVKSLLLLTFNNPASNNIQKRHKTRVFGVLVECLQNICKHGSAMEGKSELKPGIALIGKNEHSYRIGVGNIITNDKVADLMKTIESLNNMTQDELKKEQINILKTTQLSLEGNAGLGMIQIARKTTGPMSYYFKKLSDTKTFYSLEVHINIE